MATDNNYDEKEGMDDIVFEGRNKEYGAYYLRKKYNKYILVAFLIAFVIVASSVITPLVASYYNRDKHNKNLAKNVTIEIDRMKQEEPPPPPPPPPPPEAIQEVVKFKAPVVVDSTVKEVQLASNDDIIASNTNEAPPTEIVVEEKKDPVIVEEEKVFFFVEENATFQGGDVSIFRDWVQQHMTYPASAVEMGIEGTVNVQFVVNTKGGVEGVKILRSLDPAIDQEVTKTILSSPKWVPGKQSGKSVKQSFSIPIKFKLNK